jgi:uncharacterized protein YdaU (DUF1376 family)
MKHYPHHIGDFDRATRHLSRLERSIYRDLIDLYYDTEHQLTWDLQVLCRRIIARSNEESTAVEQVLNEFFVQTPAGWYHERCETEIDAYQANNSQKAQAGKASAAAKAFKRQQALNGKLTGVEQPLPPVDTELNGASTNHQPINQSTNQPKEKSAKAPPTPKPDDVELQVWTDWVQLRKAKRSTVSPTVIDEARAEAAKAGLSLERFLSIWCARGSQGLQAEWLKPNERSNFSPQQNTSKYAAAARTIFGNDTDNDRRTINA